jgi:hypothetical protein
MVSTKGERVHRARELTLTLIGEKFKGSYKRPITLPKGVNYTSAEWRILLQVLDKLRSNDDVSINHLFEMEEIESRYLHQLVLAKFGG